MVCGLPPRFQLMLTVFVSVATEKTFGEWPPLFDARQYPQFTYALPPESYASTQPAADSQLLFQQSQQMQYGWLAPILPGTFANSFPMASAAILPCPPWQNWQSLFGVQPGALQFNPQQSALAQQLYPQRQPALPTAVNGQSNWQTSFNGQSNLATGPNGQSNSQNGFNGQSNLPMGLNKKRHCISPGCIESATGLLKSIDTTADPCDNFYKFACGKWLDRKTVAEADTPAYTARSGINRRVFGQVKDLITQDTPLSIGRSNAVDTLRRIYKICMNMDAITQRLSKPLFDTLRQILPVPALGQPLVGQFDINRIVAMTAQTLAQNPFWQSFATFHPSDARQYVLTLDQADLDKEMLLGVSPRSATDLRAITKGDQDVLALVAKDAGLTVSAAQISAGVQKSLEFQKQLAALTRKGSERRNATELNNPWTIRELKQRVNMINWDAYLDAVYSPAAKALFRNEETQIIVKEPNFFTGLNALLRSTDPETLANYVGISIIRNLRSSLDNRFEQIATEVLTVLNGPQRGQKPRDATCMGKVMGLEEIVGAMYVDKYFDDGSKREADNMITNIVVAMEELINGLPWMDAETKRGSVRKLNKVARHVGFPAYAKNAAQLDERYKDLNINANDGYFEVNLKVGIFTMHKNFQNLLRPVDRNEFIMGPAEVNAYYNPALNAMQFPAAILQPHLFRGDYPKSINYGAIGAVMGHELVHGFDDMGAQYDENGILRNWWSPSAAANFKTRKQCMIRQYDSYHVESANMTLRGDATIGENIADNGGIKIAFRAFKKLQARYGDEPLLPALNLTNDQVFFTAYGADWCALQKADASRNAILYGVHSIEEFRVIGPLSNSEDFARAFNCPVGSRMNPTKSDRTKCEVW